jgi:hypothetical protein
MQESNIANIFVASNTMPDGVLVGYNFEAFIFVIVDVVPLAQINTLQSLSDLLAEPKFRAFSWSCAGHLMVLGVLENKGTAISTSPKVLEFKSDQNIWINISSDNGLKLKDLIVCEYKYTQVLANFIVYPQLKTG